MAHKKSLEALDTTLKHLSGNNLLFGGITLVLAGDFCQTLPVIKRSTPADELNVYLKESHLWPYVDKLRLTTNMRIHLNANRDSDTFSAALLSIGNGTFDAESIPPFVAL